MMSEKKKKKQSSENPHVISRREFAIGSMAFFGAYSLAEDEPIPPLSPEAQAMKIEMDGMVRARMETRHILDDDVKRVIDHAEKTGEKLYQQESKIFLSKLRVKEVYFYVEYSPVEDGYKIYSTYSHRFLLEGDKQNV
jgi:hypothetical protein